MAPKSPLRVLVAGGGIAALETLIALRELAGERVDLHLLADAPYLVYRPAAVTAPFSSVGPPRFDLRVITDRLGVSLHHGELHTVDLGRHIARTVVGAELPFDVLVVAVGAKPLEGLPGALTFRGAGDSRAFEAVLHQVREGTIQRLAFALPGGVAWSLPIYELALLTAAQAHQWELGTLKLMVVSPEDSPLALFGARASAAIAELLQENRIEWVEGYPAGFEDGELRVVPGGNRPVDQVIALPRQEGPRIKGLPANQDGFLETNQHGRVWASGDVYAAGDATAFPIKQGGLAAQQADAVAQAIAAHAGADVRPFPFEPILRGQLLTGEGSRFMRHVIRGGVGDTSSLSESSLWWPPSKISARYLSAFLAGEQGAAAHVPDGSEGIEVRVELDAKEASPNARQTLSLATG